MTYPIIQFSGTIKRGNESCVAAAIGGRIQVTVTLSAEGDAKIKYGVNSASSKLTIGPDSGMIGAQLAGTDRLLVKCDTADVNYVVYRVFAP